LQKLLKHKTSKGEIICYRKADGNGPTLVWLGGFRSDMDGSKAAFAHEWAAQNQQAFIRFDYFGHGQSSGKFEDGSISRWRDDVLEIIDHLTVGPVILAGSSMGGWLALLSALARPERVNSLVLIAPAPDFTEKLLWNSLSKNIQNQIMQHGVWQQPSPYGPVPITRKLIEDGRKHLILDQPIAFDGPVRILQGQMDTDVPWEYALKLINVIQSTDVIFTLNKTGDHSLSTAADLDKLQQALQELTRCKKT